MCLLSVASSYRYIVELLSILSLDCHPIYQGKMLYICLLTEISFVYIDNNVKRLKKSCNVHVCDKSNCINFAQGNQHQ